MREMNAPWPAETLDEYEKLVIRMNAPSVVIDNSVCPDVTLIKVDGLRKHGILLEVVQVLTDLDLSIRKAYISSCGRWFMDVFHVSNSSVDERLVSFIEYSLAVADSKLVEETEDTSRVLATLELNGTDRPGLFSELCAVLSDFDFAIADARVWTHKGRAAALVSIKDLKSGSFVDDPDKIALVTTMLRNVLNRDHDLRGAKTSVSTAAVGHADRRLHQLMFADRDYELVSVSTSTTSSRPSVTVQNWTERGYSAVRVQCRDRPKLLFDVVCTLTDMEYVVFHGTLVTISDGVHLNYISSI